MHISSIATLKPSGNTAVSEIDGGLALIDLETGDYFYLNGTASVVWAGVKAEKSAEAIASDLSSQFDVAVDDALADVLALLDDMVRLGFAEAV